MQSIKQHSGIVVLCVALLATALLLQLSQVAHGNVTSEAPSAVDTLQTYTFFATSTNQSQLATSTTATSTNIPSWTDSKGQIDNGWVRLSGAKKVNFYFGRGDQYGGGNTGSTTYRVQVTPDGINWYYWNNWQTNASTSIQSAGGTSATFVAIGTTTIEASMVLLNDAYLGARCIVVEATDGWHACSATVQY